jgi:hypothetical protein
MGELAARNLLAKGVAGLAVVGRTPERAQQLALECGSQVALAQLESALPQSDIVISCTSAPHQVISREMVEAAMRERAGRPLFLIDMLFRDVNPPPATTRRAPLQHRRPGGRVVSTAGAPGASRRERSSTGVGSSDGSRSATRLPTIAALRDRAESIRQTELAGPSLLAVY